LFASNDGNRTNSVTGSALTPPQLSVAPASFNFGTVAVGSNALANFVVTNLGGAPLTNGSASVSGGGFTVLSGAFFNLPGNGATNVAVQFSPTNAGSFSNAVLITTGNGGSSTNGVVGAGAFVPVANFTGTPTAGLKPLTVN